MNTNTTRVIDIQEKIINQLLPVCQKLRDEGFSDSDIQKYVRDHHKKIVFDFYGSQNLNKIDNVLLSLVGEFQDAGSKIELLFYDFLKTNDIPFKFQYKIGFYRADFLLWEDLVVELDGPQHELQKDKDKIRDAYLKKMGYRVLRIPTWILVEKPQEVIEMILEHKPKEKTKKRKRTLTI
jgi:very-short-patch-repair endonuclease